jgi:hypothetical protein
MNESEFRVKQFVQRLRSATPGGEGDSGGSGSGNIGSEILVERGVERRGG